VQKVARRFDIDAALVQSIVDLSTARCGARPADVESAVLQELRALHAKLDTLLERKDA
jgi:hypothetical protein